MADVRESNPDLPATGLAMDAEHSLRGRMQTAMRDQTDVDDLIGTGKALDPHHPELSDAIAGGGDPLGAVRGFAFGTVLSLPLWCIIAAVIYWVA
jgi:hypothetical protein